MHVLLRVPQVSEPSFWAAYFWALAAALERAATRPHSPHVAGGGESACADASEGAGTHARSDGRAGAGAAAGVSDTATAHASSNGRDGAPGEGTAGRDCASVVASASAAQTGDDAMEEDVAVERVELAAQEAFIHKVPPRARGGDVRYRLPLGPQGGGVCQCQRHELVPRVGLCVGLQGQRLGRH